MLKQLFFCLAFGVSISAGAQTTLKASKPISKIAWAKLAALTGQQLYGTVTIVNDQGIAERLVGDKPTNPQDKVSWRPPPIPPKDNPDGATPGKKPATKIGTVKPPSSIKPKPFDPGCAICSVIIFQSGTPPEIIKQAEEILKEFN